MPQGRKEDLAGKTVWWSPQHVRLFKKWWGVDPEAGVACKRHEGGRRGVVELVLESGVLVAVPREYVMHHPPGWDPRSERMTDAAQP